MYEKSFGFSIYAGKTGKESMRQRLAKFDPSVITSEILTRVSARLKVFKHL